MPAPALSIVVPCFNEAGNLERLHDEALQALTELGVDAELVLVDDGSRDATRAVALRLSERDPRVRVISFSRNFGKEAAMLAGLRAARGEVVALMDADLQHPPRLLCRMYQMISTGEADQVVARRTRQHDPWLRRQLSRLYYGCVNSLIEVELQDGVGDYRMLSRRAVDALLQLTEANRFSKGLFAWIGFPVVELQYSGVGRAVGESSWTLSSLLNYGIDGVVAFNHRPLRLLIYAGLASFGLGLAYLAWLLVNAMLVGIDVPGYITTIAVIVFFGGVQLLSLGIMGEYIGRIYAEVKHRPHYVVALDSKAGRPAGDG
ncbi:MULTISPECIES: glycosyltransferase family 2 protein [unclassified Luteococcus]|uniref:glycosyltransferase family 2 protein n=1 Tax=unclassified Luteococcus TaxID=2639923 RepID=UPI00313E338B